jgi:hypothetical protein
MFANLSDSTVALSSSRPGVLTLFLLVLKAVSIAQPPLRTERLNHLRSLDQRNAGRFR